MNVLEDADVPVSLAFRLVNRLFLRALAGSIGYPNVEHQLQCVWCWPPRRRLVSTKKYPGGRFQHSRTANERRLGGKNRLALAFFKR